MNPQAKAPGHPSGVGLFSVPSAAVAVALVAALLALPALDPLVTFSPFPRLNPQTNNTLPLSTDHFTRSTLSFPCSGVQCEAWLYLPRHTQGPPPPVVVLAHGMGAQKDMGLHNYASAFAQSGMAAFVFDYRSFGGSDGEPRHWVSPSRHVQDWVSALHFVRESLSDTLNTSRVALWGTSFAGGHVLKVAAHDPNISAVVSQVPHLDALLASRNSIRQRGLVQSVRCLVAGVHDWLRTALGLPPAYVPLVGEPGSLALMQLNEFERKEWASKHPQVKQGGWRNLARASLYVELVGLRYSPIKHVPEVEAPILFVAASTDTLCPLEAVEKAHALARDAQLLVRNCIHFELYRGALLEGLLAVQVAFLQRHLGVPETALDP